MDMDAQTPKHVRAGDRRHLGKSCAMKAPRQRARQHAVRVSSSRVCPLCLRTCASLHRRSWTQGRAYLYSSRAGLAPLQEGRGWIELGSVLPVLRRAGRSPKGDILTCVCVGCQSYDQDRSTAK